VSGTSAASSVGLKMRISSPWKNFFPNAVRIMYVQNPSSFLVARSKSAWKEPSYAYTWTTPPPLLLYSSRWFANSCQLASILSFRVQVCLWLTDFHVDHSCFEACMFKAGNLSWWLGRVESRGCEVSGLSELRRVVQMRMTTVVYEFRACLVRYWNGSSTHLSLFAALKR